MFNFKISVFSEVPTSRTFCFCLFFRFANFLTIYLGSCIKMSNSILRLKSNNLPPELMPMKREPPSNSIELYQTMCLIVNLPIYTKSDSC